MLIKSWVFEVPPKEWTRVGKVREKRKHRMETTNNRTAKKKYDSGGHYNLIWHGLVKPWVIFLKKFIVQRGFMDGYYGFVISVLTSFLYFLNYINFRSMKENKN